MSALLPCKHPRPFKLSALADKGKRALRLLQTLLLLGCYSPSFAVDIPPANRYHFVLEQGKYNKTGEISYSKYFSLGTSAAYGYLRVAYWPKDSLWLGMIYPGTKKAFAESIYSKFPTRSEAWVAGPRRSFDVYLGEQKSLSLSSSFNVTEARVLLPALARRIKVDYDNISDQKQFLVDIDPAIPIYPQDDARINRAAWKPQPYYIQNSDQTYPDQARITVVDGYKPRVNSSCLASDTIGKIQQMEVELIAPVADARFSPMSLARVRLDQPVYNLVVLLQVRLSEEMLRLEQEGKALHTFRVTCTTTRGKRLAKEVLFGVAEGL